MFCMHKFWRIYVFLNLLLAQLYKDFRLNIFRTSFEGFFFEYFACLSFEGFLFEGFLHKFQRISFWIFCLHKFLKDFRLNVFHTSFEGFLFEAFACTSFKMFFSSLLPFIMNLPTHIFKEFLFNLCLHKFWRIYFWTCSHLSFEEECLRIALY